MSFFPDSDSSSLWPKRLQGIIPWENTGSRPLPEMPRPWPGIVWTGTGTTTISDRAPESNKLLEVDHIFYQRVKLLAIMAKSFAEGSPVGQHRRMAIRNNIDYICEALQFNPQEENLQLLKVA